MRLLYAVVLNALIFVAAYRLARRWTGDRLQATSDAFLLFYLVQYLSICIPGLAGALSPYTIISAALLFCAIMWAAVMRRPALSAIDLPPRERLIVVAAGLFAIGYT